MKLLIPSFTLCACISACGEPEVIQNAPSEPGAAAQLPAQNGERSTAEPKMDSEAAPHEPERDSSGKGSAAKAALGQLAPEFELKDLTGKLHKLSRHKGKTIVLEWFNPGCPFVVNVHEEGPLKEMPLDYKAEDVVWIAINSGAPGAQGTSPKMNVNSVEKWEMRYPLLFDPSGEVGKLYGATTTPHMFVIDEDFVLRYSGALDNAPMGKADGEYANYVSSAIEAISKGEPCPNPVRPYGCGVKYAD